MNAAWWLISVLSFNINEIMKQTALPKKYWSNRLKKIRFLFINISARVLRTARKYVLRIGSDEDVALLIQAMVRIRNLSPVDIKT